MSAGKIPSTACQDDQRFSYCLYVPRTPSPRERRLLVAIHGSERDNQTLCDLFAPLADALNLIVLAPLFPCGIEDPNDQDNYKYIEYRNIRFDRILLSMIAEVGASYDVDTSRFSLFGFSGGAHFAHRFLYLYPERLNAVSIGAPGSVTLLDTERDWWVGVADIGPRFGRPLDLSALRRVDVHLCVGGGDTDVRGIVQGPESKHWMEGAERAGHNRVERLESLHASLMAHAIPARLEILPEVGHRREPITAAATEFFTAILRRDDAAA